MATVMIAGVALRGRQASGRDFFAARLPWPAVCLSVVATETSILTFLSIPGLAYAGNLSFLQLAAGYIIGRVIVAAVLLPAYFRGEVLTSYELLRRRIGPRMHLFSALLFLVTRLLADGVRLYASAVPLALLSGCSVQTAVAAAAAVTLLYTAVGGIRSVVWMDVLQLTIYLAGALLAFFFLLNKLPGDVVRTMVDSGKLSFLDTGSSLPFGRFFQSAYTLPAGLIGGAFLSLASHGSDHLIVQRLLTCRSLKEAQRALVLSGVIVFVQFLLFLLIGVLLFFFYNGAPQQPDAVLPRFIMENMPELLAGVLIASLFAAAMSTLSSSLNSLASSTVIDLLQPHMQIKPRHELLVSRAVTVGWAAALCAAALLIPSSGHSLVELGLSIASFTYGGVLGVFLSATAAKRPSEPAMLFALWTGIALMIPLIGPSAGVRTIMTAAVAALGLAFLPSLRPRLRFAAAALFLIILLPLPSPRLAWTWFVPFGTAITAAAARLAEATD